jgi:PAS domain S-box-containing protein
MAIVIALLRLATQSLTRSSKQTAWELSERRKTEHRLSLALAAGEIGIWDVEAIAGDFHADSRCFEIFGLPPTVSNVISRATWIGMIHPEDRHVMRSAIGDLLGGAPRAKLQFRIIRPDGSVRHVELTAVPIDRSDGQRPTHVGTIVDITERTKAAEERDLLTGSLRERVRELRVLHLAAGLLRNHWIEVYLQNSRLLSPKP